MVVLTLMTAKSNFSSWTKTFLLSGVKLTSTASVNIKAKFNEQHQSFSSLSYLNGSNITSVATKMKYQHQRSKTTSFQFTYSKDKPKVAKGLSI